MKKFWIAALVGTAAAIIAVGCATPAPPPVATQDTEPTAELPFTEVPAESTSGPTPEMPLDPVDGVKRFQALALLPDTKPTFSENAFMANSPSGTFKVMVYKDPDGRVFSINPATFNVVEYDGRSLMSVFDAKPREISEAEQQAIAEKLIAATIPDFDSIKSALTYQGGRKGDIFFYDWRGTVAQGMSMAPMVQVAVHRTGEILGYINTLDLTY